MKDKIKNILSSIRLFLYFPSIKYSAPFYFLREFFSFGDRERMVKTAMEFISFCKIKGDYLEFGVWRGETFSSAVHLAKKNKISDMKFYAFDSFEGLPELTGVDKEYKEFNKGGYSCGLEVFKRNISRRGVEPNEIKLIPGWYDDVLNKKTKDEMGGVKLLSFG